MSLQEAANHVINEKMVKLGGDGGVVAINAKGDISMPFNSEGMYRGSIDVNKKLTVQIYKDD